MFYLFDSVVSKNCFVQIAREIVISPNNARLGLTALTRKNGLLDQPDSPDGELIKYKVWLFHCKRLSLMVLIFHYIIILLCNLLMKGVCYLLVGRPKCDTC